MLLINRQNLVKQHEEVLEICTTLYMQSTVVYCTLTHFVKRVDLVKVSYHSKINVFKKGVQAMRCSRCNYIYVCISTLAQFFTKYRNNLKKPTVHSQYSMPYDAKCNTNRTFLTLLRPLLISIFITSSIYKSILPVCWFRKRGEK